MSADRGTDGDAQQAIARGVAGLEELGVDRQKYRLVGARSAVLTKAADPFRWQLDFKSASTIPAQRGGIVGKGGTLSIEVDLETGEVTQLSRGD